MPKISEEKVKLREDEIIEACKKLYDKKSFSEITITDIGDITSFTRTSIYNYFNTKEEIFLALLKKEYEKWTEELLFCAAEKDCSTPNAVAEILALTLSRRSLMLKLLSMNMYDIEENSRAEKLVEFKVAYGGAIKAAEGILTEKLSFSKERAEEFIYSFFPFVFGVYPYTGITQKQKEAMLKAGVEFKQPTVYDIVLVCAKKLLSK